MKQQIQKPKANRISSSGSLRENLLRRKKVKTKSQTSDNKSSSQIHSKPNGNSTTNS